MKMEKRLEILVVSALGAAAASARVRAEKLAREGYYRCAYEELHNAAILADKISAIVE